MSRDRTQEDYLLRLHHDSLRDEVSWLRGLVMLLQRKLDRCTCGCPEPTPPPDRSEPK